MGWFVRFITSSIGAKVIMAVTGIALVAFLIGHVLANLLIYSGPTLLNEYAEYLKSNPALLWSARSGLLLAVGLHIWAGVRLSRLNRAARPQAYAVKSWRRATPTSRTMIWTGVLLLAFIVVHLGHFTIGVFFRDYFIPKDVFSMVVRSFQNPLVSWMYIVSMVFLAFHLNHGVSSLFQSLGLNHARYNPLIHRLGPAFAAVIALGFISIPVAVMMGWVGLR